VELLNRLEFVRCYIFRGLLSGDCGPIYRRDSPGDIWDTRLRRIENQKRKNTDSYRRNAGATLGYVAAAAAEDQDQDHDKKDQA
jgi:hypothetical protein